MKTCAAGRVVGSPQAAAMRLNDRPTDGQPHTSPVILGGKECLEDLFRLLRGQSHTGVADGDQQLTTLAHLRLDRKFTSSVLHGLDSVEDEVHEHLLKLHSVCGDFGKIRR